MSNYYDNQKLSQQDRQNHIEMVKKSFPKQPSVETKIEEILKENFEYVILQRNSEFCIQGEDFNDIKEIYRATEELLALFSTQQAQMMDKINSAIDNVKYMKFFSSSRALEELRDDVLNIIGGSDE